MTAWVSPSTLMPAKDEPIANADLEYFTDSGSFMENEQCKAQYAIVTSWDTVEAKSLPHNASAQKAELIALTRALEIAEGKPLNVYPDSKYVSRALHAHRAIWKE